MSAIWILPLPRVSSLNTTTNNKSNSIGLNAGGNANTNSAKLNRVSLDYTNNKHNSKTKVLATLGKEKKAGALRSCGCCQLYLLLLLFIF
jgi:hypothetical protein